MNRFIACSLVATLTAPLCFSQSSSGKTHPKQVLQIYQELKDLVAHQEDAILTLSEADTDKIVQVGWITAKGEPLFNLNIAYYPSTEPPEEALSAAGIEIPAGWKQIGFDAGTFAAYALPKRDAKQLPYFIHSVFRKFFNSGSDYRLVAGIDSAEDELESDFDPDSVTVTVTGGDQPDANRNDVDGTTISFPGLVSTTSLNGALTEARIGNMDENMKQYMIVLDAKGRALANEKMGAVQVTGRVTVKKGKRMLVVTDYEKWTNTPPPKKPPKPIQPKKARKRPPPASTQPPKTVKKPPVQVKSSVPAQPLMSKNEGPEMKELIAAVSSRQVDRVEQMLEATPELVNQCNPAGFSPLHYAARKGDIEMGQLLLEKNADVSGRQANHGGTPLQYAASGGHKEFAEFLIENGAGVDATDTNGRTPLMWAAKAGHVDIADMLIARGADVNATAKGGWTALHQAAQGQHKDVVILLVGNHANPNAQNAGGQTPKDLNPSLFKK